MKNDQQELIHVLMNGGIAVIRTDTLYGIVARANDEEAVQRVYDAKSRNEKKSCIVLIADAQQAYGPVTVDLTSFDVPTSVLIESPDAPKWLMRANGELAHRLPDVPWLQQVIREVGPLIAPSANPEGLAPALTIDQAKAYFGDAVDLYVDGGEVSADMPPSQLIRLHLDGSSERLR